jgi:PPM family protein phosphatase
MSSGKTENLETASVSYLCAAASHVGLWRSRNEDRFLIDPLNDFFLVVDGMGGHACGEVAAQIAAETIGEDIRCTAGDDETRLRDSIIRANNAIFLASRRDEKFSGMGCVLAALLLKDGMATVANVGDARVYRVHPGGIELLTTDHSVVGELEKNGELSEIRLMQHPRRNEVLRCVGVKERAAPGEDFVDIITADFQPDQAFLLCSDGLSDLVTSSQLLDIILAHAESPKMLVGALIDKANVAGGKDNITAVVVIGGGFCQAAETMKRPPPLTYKQRLITVLYSRWAMLLYGLFAGGLAVFLMRS